MNWQSKKILITGGAGFIGSNLAKKLFLTGAEVTILDNFSRANVRKNIKWLEAGGGKLNVIEADIRDKAKIDEAVKGMEYIFHEAAQVAVTDSVNDPLTDFDVNAGGTLNILDGMRQYSPEAVFLFASTNKVYGGLERFAVKEKDNKYFFSDTSLINGVTEEVNLDFHSPYGCSKGSADQYVRDFSRIYGLKTLVFRQSCIYGPRQWGTEDQGWVFHFLRLAYGKELIKIYGDGKQVRDLLYIDDLLRAYEMAIDCIDKTSGHIYNIGGGIQNSVSLLEAIEIMKGKLGIAIPYEMYPWRPGDQRVFVSDTTKAQTDFGWSPQVSVPDGIERLLEWVKEIN